MTIRSGLTGIAALALAGALGATVAAAELRQTETGPVSITEVAGGLDTPWALAFLPGGGFLVTERDGRLLHFDADGRRQTVRGVPTVEARGQGGLLDVLVPRDFAQSRQVYLTYAKRQRPGAGTALAVGTLSPDGRRLDDLRTIYEIAPGSTGGRHFGSRLVEAPDGSLFMTIGDRGDDDTAQNVAWENGSVLRLDRAGRPLGDNPLVGREGAKPAIWSWGHRNPQGAALDAEGRLWAVEHGARGGDEVNLIRKGANYGWPVISYGRHYSGARIGEGTEKPGMEQPAHYWDPSIAPSGMVIHSGRMFDDWAGDVLVGSLKFDLISRLERRGDALVEVERIEFPETLRVRDLREAPDGALWVISEGHGAIYRMVPAGEG